MAVGISGGHGAAAIDADGVNLRGVESKIDPDGAFAFRSLGHDLKRRVGTFAANAVDRHGAELVGDLLVERGTLGGGFLLQARRRVVGLRKRLPCGSVAIGGFGQRLEQRTDLSRRLLTHHLLGNCRRHGDERHGNQGREHTTDSMHGLISPEFAPEHCQQFVNGIRRKIGGWF
ncbi:MAG: hypothetical protein FJW22_13025 [Acidimicrobiia bacterium]|nr:hypothetical protein [Acidimicrobiia bacterium]